MLETVLKLMFLFCAIGLTICVALIHEYMQPLHIFGVGVLVGIIITQLING